VVSTPRFPQLKKADLDIFPTPPAKSVRSETPKEKPEGFVKSSFVPQELAEMTTLSRPPANKRPEILARVSPPPAVVPASAVASTPLPASPLVPATPPQGFIKTATADRNYRKVAKFLMLIGKEEAARILAKLDPDQIEKVSRELASITRVEPVEAVSLLAEFKSLLSGGIAGAPRAVSGGIETARALLRTAFGAEKGDAVLRRAVPESAESPFAFLEDFEGDQTALLFKDEAPGTTALVLSRLSPKAAAAAIAVMESSVKLEVLKRIAKLGKVAPEVLASIAASLREKARTIGRQTGETVDGRSALAEILKRADASLGDRLLEELKDSDPELGMDLKERLFTLDDVVMVEDRKVQERLRSMSDKEIALLIKGRRPAFVEKLMSNISAQRRVLVAEEREILGPIPRSEQEPLTKEFIAWFRLEKDAGRLIMMDDSDLIL
jgi:flagellar motor switch protein FliG